MMINNNNDNNNNDNNNNDNNNDNNNNNIYLYTVYIAEHFPMTKPTVLTLYQKLKWWVFMNQS
jgi:hypothetical protein